MQRIILTFLFFLWFHRIFGVEWNQFRGVDGQGHAEGKKLPVKWSRTHQIAWNTKIEGSAWSSPICVDNQIFLSNALLKEGNLKLVALSIDYNSGRVNWRRELFEYSGQPKIHKKNSYASPTPFYNMGRIYVHFGNLGTACLEKDGDLIWKSKIEYSPVHGSGASPVVHNDLLLLSADGAQKPSLYALNKTNGLVNWKVLRDSKAKRNFSFCTPLVVKHDGQSVIISPASDYVFAYDMMGKQIWKFNYPDGYSVVPRPVYSNGIIYVSSGYDSPVLYAIKLGGRGDVTKSHLVWKTRKGAPRNSSVLVVDDLLFMAADNGVVSCLNSRDGTLHWMNRVAGSCSASLLYGNGNIYLIDESGKTFIFDAKKSFRISATNDLGERTLASPIVYKESLLIRTEIGLWKIHSD